MTDPATEPATVPPPLPAQPAVEGVLYQDNSITLTTARIFVFGRQYAVTDVAGAWVVRMPRGRASAIVAAVIGGVLLLPALGLLQSLREPGSDVMDRLALALALGIPGLACGGAALWMLTRPAPPAQAVQILTNTGRTEIVPHANPGTIHAALCAVIGAQAEK